MPWVSCSSRFRDISAVVAPLLVAALPTCGNRTTLSKTLPPGVPVAARNEELTDIIEWLGEPVRQVDSSLLDEWEQLASPHQPLDAPVAVPVRPRPLTGNERAFTAMVRNALFRRVELFARRRSHDLGQLDAATGWTAERWEEVVDTYFAEHDDVVIGADARRPALLIVDRQAQRMAGTADPGRPGRRPRLGIRDRGRLGGLRRGGHGRYSADRRRPHGLVRPSSVVAVQFLLVDVFTSTPYRGNSLTVFPDAGGVTSTQMAEITRELRQFESIFLNPAGLQHHWRAHIFDLFEELDFAGHPVIGAAAVLHHRHGGDAVRGRWTMELASGALTVETERRGPAAFHAVMPEMVATFLGEPSDISRVQVASWFSLLNGDLDPRLPLEVVSTGLRYLIVPVRDGALARARISHRELDVALTAFGAEYAYLLDAGAGEGRHWNNDGVVEDAATGSAAGCVAAYLHRHGLLREDHASELGQGRFINRPSRITISARSVGDETLVRVGGEVVLVGSGRLDLLPS